jgi:hypothetical protein
MNGSVQFVKGSTLPMVHSYANTCSEMKNNIKHQVILFRIYTALIFCYLMRVKVDSSTLFKPSLANPVFTMFHQQQYVINEKSGKTDRCRNPICSSTPIIIFEFIFNFSKQTKNIRIAWFLLQII